MEVYKFPPFSGIKTFKDTLLAIIATNILKFSGCSE
jgi:hypothetical protein